MFYFAHNLDTDEIFSSPSFKRVYTAVKLECQYTEQTDALSRWFICSCPGEYDKTSYKEMEQNKKLLFIVWATYSTFCVSRVSKIAKYHSYYFKNRNYNRAEK